MKKCPICGCENNAEFLKQVVVDNDKSLNLYQCRFCGERFITVEKALCQYDVDKLKRSGEENFNGFLSSLLELYHS